MNELQERGLALLRDDLTLFASECLAVAPKAPGPNIPLNFNSAQMFVHQRLEDQIAHAGWVRALVLKGRQQGISTYVAARYYHRTSMQRGNRALIIAHEQTASDNLFEMVRRYHKANPLRPSIQASNAKELKFGALGSGYRVSTAGTKDTGRGGTFQLAHASEYGFWPNADGHSAGLAQTVADLPGTEIIKESTANGVGNAFHIEWQQAESGEGDYIPIFVPWFWQDEYRRRVPIDFEIDANEERIMNAYGLSLEQMAWRQAKIKSLGADRSWIFVQEYPMTASEAFISRTEDPFIPVVLVMEAINNAYREVYGPLIVGVDPAEHGEDRTAIVFRRGRLVTRIETYKDKETMETAGIVAHIINEHKPDAVMIDSIGIGAGIYSRLRELGHDNVISVRSGRRARDDKQYVNKRAEMWADMKKWLEERPCRMPNNLALASDLSAPQYGYDSSGRLQIEPKPKMKARSVRSPDIADALCLTFAEPVSTARHDKLIVTAQPAYAGPASHAGY